MRIEEELSRIAPQGPVMVTIGVFDGVHRGQQHLLQRLREEADHRSYQTAVVTFSNHPRSVLQPGLPVRYLTILEERLRLLRAQGMDYVISVPFTLELSLFTPRQFVALLYDHLNMRGIVVGPDFALGHQRRGTVPVLRALGAEMGFAVAAVEPVQRGDQVVSSTAIRDALARGDLDTVTCYLGRPFRLMGRVERGAGRGRVMGFPTANIEVGPDQALPTDGVYATWACVDDRWHKSATNIGVRPTFGGGQRTVEAFIMDFDDDLYQQEVKLDFAGRLRDETKFPSAEALTAQMKQDVKDARRTLDIVGPGCS